MVDLSTLGSLALTLLKCIGSVALVYLLTLALFHVRALRRLAYYQKQGALVMPGARRFFFGNSLDYKEYAKARAGPEVVRGPQAWLIFDYYPRLLGLTQQGKQFRADEYPVVVANFQSVPDIWVSDPEIVQDIFVGKNSLLDKSIDSFLMFKDVIGQSFIFSLNDETWKQKRKAMSHAFYRDRLQHMLETLKTVVLETFASWASKIDKNGSHEVNMATEFSDILASNILHICFGEDISNEILSLQVKDAKTGEWSTKQMAVKDSIYIIVGQVTDRYLKSVSHPINWLYPHTHTLLTVHSDAHKIKENCQAGRAWVMKYVEERRAGKRQSSVGAQTDILSLMLSRADVFTDEFITDEMLGFFGAATETTHNVLQTILTHLIKDKESLGRVRQEFNNQVLTGLLKANPALAGAPIREQLAKGVTVDSCFDLDYLNNVICEGLRFQSPGGITPVTFDREVTLGNKLTVKKGDHVRVLHWALHKNPAEWQRPDEFLPNRFDPQSPLFLTPAGKKRHAMSWLPWSAGKRVCFGKTFAESNLKIMLTYFTQHFDFEFVDNQKYATSYPIAVMTQSKTPPIMVKLTNRSKRQ